MNLAYLVNQYPQPSQTFIRREIAAIERSGTTIHRFTIRRYTGPLPDPADQEERENTFAILDSGSANILSSLFWAFSTRPLATFSALHTSLVSGWERSRSRFLPLAYFLEACVLTRILIRRKIDHLHVHFGTNSAAVAQLSNELGGPQYSFTCHGPEEFDRPEVLGLGEKVRHAAFAITISDFGRSQLCRWSSPSDWSKIHVVRCGLDDSFLSFPPSPVPDVARLVCVGRLEEQKGHLILIQSAALVTERFPNFELLVVGDGPLRAEIEQAVIKLNLTSVVKLLGWKSNLEIRNLLLDSRGLVLSSFAEGLPVVVMESLALGRPVIATRVMGIPELVRPNETGWLVPPADPVSLAAAIVELLGTAPSTLTKMGCMGKTLVSERHSATREAMSLVDLIKAHKSIY